MIEMPHRDKKKQREYQKNYYATHPEYREKQLFRLKLKYSKEDKREYNKERYRKLIQWAINKLGRICLSCGLVSEYDCVYDFHHIDKKDAWKRDSSNKVKTLVKWHNQNSIPDYIELLCANCHRIKEHGKRAFG